MGTFIIRATTVVSGGTPLTDANISFVPPQAGWIIDYTLSTSLLAVINQTGPLYPLGTLEALDKSNLVELDFIQSLRLGCGGTSIYLDGSTDPIALADLPKGFSPTSAEVMVNMGTIRQSGGTAHYHLQQKSGVIGTTDSNSFAYPPPTASMASIVGGGFGIDVNLLVTGGSNSCSIAFNDLRIEGIYVVLSYGATVTPSNPAFTTVGDIITIASVGPASGMDLSHVSVNITYLDSSNVLQTINAAPSIQNPQQFVFTMPNFTTAVQVTVNAVGDGTQFSGSVALGILLTNNFTDGTGIYVLEPGKTNDTLYAQGSNPIQTVAVAIPNPFIKTGFIP